MQRSILAVVGGMCLMLVATSTWATTTTINAQPVTNAVGSPDFADGFGPGSWQANATTGKSEFYVTPQELFGRNVTVGDLASISYFTKKDTTHSANTADWFFAIYTAKYVGQDAGWYGNRISTEPYFAEDIVETAGTWTQWVTGDGQNNRLRFFDSTNNQYFGSYTDGFLSALTASNAYKDQQIMYFSIQTGSAWASGFTGLVDGLNIELTTGDIGQVNMIPVPVPEPLTMTAAFLAIGGLGSYLRKRSRLA